MNQAKTDKYVFEWCKKCDYLDGCYYQGGEYSGHPHFLEPACGSGPVNHNDKIRREQEQETFVVAEDTNTEDEE